MYAIRVKRIYDPVEPNDGLRILVDRIWPRGLSKHQAAVDLWMKDIAPSHALRKWFGHRPDRWHEFRQRYHRELDNKPDHIRELVRYVTERPVTLLYSAKATEANQALALLEYLMRQDPGQPGDPPLSGPKLDSRYSRHGGDS